MKADDCKLAQLLVMTLSVRMGHIHTAQSSDQCDRCVYRVIVMYIHNVKRLCDVNGMIYFYNSCATSESLDFHSVSDSVSAQASACFTHICNPQDTDSNLSLTKTSGTMVKCLELVCYISPSVHGYERQTSCLAQLRKSAIGTRGRHSVCPPRPIHRSGMCLTLCTPCIILRSNCIFNVLLLQCQERYVGTCMSVYLGFPEGGVLALKRIGILRGAFKF